MKWKYIRLGKFEKNIKKYNKRITKLNYEEWRKRVIERDTSKCAVCNTTSNLAVHHIIVREDEQLRFDENNGIILCIKHHKYCRKISAHNNSFVFFIWLQKHREWQFNYLKEYAESPMV